MAVPNDASCERDAGNERAENSAVLLDTTVVNQLCTATRLLKAGEMMATTTKSKNTDQCFMPHREEALTGNINVGLNASAAKMASAPSVNVYRP